MNKLIKMSNNMKALDQIKCHKIEQKKYWELIQKRFKIEMRSTYLTEEKKYPIIWYFEKQSISDIIKSQLKDKKLSEIQLFVRF